LALRDLVAARTLDQLLEARGELAAELLRLTAESARRYGVELNRVGVRDVVLPREVRQVMMLEVEAERTGRADLVKARHEVAAARARANTAKVLAENPEVVRLQELDAVLSLAARRCRGGRAGVVWSGERTPVADSVGAGSAFVVWLPPFVNPLRRRNRPY
jgi:regulator of protease activity HflC (stomatin/prohibitin superfamily)